MAIYSEPTVGLTDDTNSLRMFDFSLDVLLIKLHIARATELVFVTLQLLLHFGHVRWRLTKLLGSGHIYPVYVTD